MGAPGKFYGYEVAQQVNETAGVASNTRDAMTPRGAACALSRLGFAHGKHDRHGNPFLAAAGQIATLAATMGMREADDTSDDTDGGEQGP